MIAMSHLTFRCSLSEQFALKKQCSTQEYLKGLNTAASLFGTLQALKSLTSDSADKVISFIIRFLDHLVFALSTHGHNRVTFAFTTF